MKNYSEKKNEILNKSPTCLNIVHAPELTEPRSRNFRSTFLLQRLSLLAVSPSSLEVTDFEGTGSEKIAQATFVPICKKEKALS